MHAVYIFMRRYWEYQYNTFSKVNFVYVTKYTFTVLGVFYVGEGHRYSPFRNENERRATPAVHYLSVMESYSNFLLHICDPFQCPGLFQLSVSRDNFFSIVPSWYSYNTPPFTKCIASVGYCSCYIVDPTSHHILSC
jgi:hypothetical protein